MTTKEELTSIEVTKRVFNYLSDKGFARQPSEPELREGERYIGDISEYCSISVVDIFNAALMYGALSEANPEDANGCDLWLHIWLKTDSGSDSELAKAVKKVIANYGHSKKIMLSEFSTADREALIKICYEEMRQPSKIITVGLYDHKLLRASVGGLMHKV